MKARFHLAGAGFTLLALGTTSCSSEAGDPRSGADAGTDSDGGVCAQNSYVEALNLAAPWCLPRAVSTSPDGSVPCQLYVARTDEQCSCPAPGRAPLPDAACEERLVAAAGQGYRCACELPQLAGPDLTDCVEDPGQLGTGGWCYVDAAPSCGPAGAAELLAACSSQKRLRLLGGAVPSAGETLLIACSGVALSCN